MIESYTSFSVAIHGYFRGNFAICPHGKSYAKFKTLQTLPYHYFQLFFIILTDGFKINKSIGGYLICKPWTV